MTDKQEDSKHSNGRTSEILTAIEAAKADLLRAGKQNLQTLKSLVKTQHTEILAELKRIQAPIVYHVTLITCGRAIQIPGLQRGEEDMAKYTLARDHAPEPFTLSPVVVADSEGPVDIPVTTTFESDNPDVVNVVDGQFVFGTFGGANATYKATLTPPGQAEQTFILDTAVFNLTPGALTVSGNISIPGLTPDPE